MNHLKILTIGIFSLTFSTCQSQTVREISTQDLKYYLDYLAGDELKGRLPGTAEDSLTQSFIADQFKAYGLKLYNGNGRQAFDFIVETKPGEQNFLTINANERVSPEDFMPFCFSSNKEVDAGVVFAGYGFDLKNDTLNRNDYEGIDVNGSWVLLFRGNPVSNDKINAFTQFEKDRDKALLAKDKGAAGVILVSGNNYDAEDELNAHKGKIPEVGLPCFQIRRNIANMLIEKEGLKIEELENQLYQKNKVNSFKINAEISGRSDVKTIFGHTANIIAFQTGDDAGLKDHYIIIGAHHDHLGMGGTGSSSRNPDTIAVHNGADDNASGVSAVLEIAGKLSTLKRGRSIIYVTFGAEEMGLLGSKFFTDNCPVPLSNIDLMINLDMVGRLRDSSLQIGGVGTADEFRRILSIFEHNKPFKFSLSEAGYGPSDHAAFYAKDKPVLFLTTGAHPEYHLPQDDVALINLEGLAAISDLTTDLALYLSNRDSSLTFRESGPKEQSYGRYRGKITLGIMPDVGSESNDGLLVLAVTDGKPASVAGMKKGDKIIAIDNLQVSNIQDYMFRLGKYKTGDRIVVTIVRNGSKLDLLVQL